MFRFSAFACVVVTVVLAVPPPAFAGQLFPPYNNGLEAQEPCQNSSVLTWTGQGVSCTDASAGITVASCPSGQMMVGINKGRAVCAAVPVPAPTTTADSGGYGGLVMVDKGGATCVDPDGCVVGSDTDPATGQYYFQTGSTQGPINGWAPDLMDRDEYEADVAAGATTGTQ